ncbi:nascent polypeptide-associated complex subunit alpha, muscle-specific form-like [Balaenoptera ricei]|uniref:nascent polypeptide-associated complex subunit alpha, muscle-specific form-like n=1 Tax=Balaenoptera ricei TaxID=2746895 RepID=UPI0028BDBB78|nr:nascent polypeptide-associated complex subunit alpha, muscle-specific form-like [Balaenoptera ricei]
MAGIGGKDLTRSFWRARSHPNAKVVVSGPNLQELTRRPPPRAPRGQPGSESLFRAPAAGPSPGLSWCGLDLPSPWTEQLLPEGHRLLSQRALRPGLGSDGTVSLREAGEPSRARQPLPGAAHLPAMAKPCHPYPQLPQQRPAGLGAGAWGPGAAPSPAPHRGPGTSSGSGTILLSSDAPEGLSSKAHRAWESDGRGPGGGTEGPHLPDRAAQAASPPGQRARPCCPRGSGAGRPPITRHRHRPGPPSLQPPLQPLPQPVPPRAPHGASERLEQRALSPASSRVGAPATPRDGPDGRRRTARSPTSAPSLRASSPPAPRGSSLSERAPRAPSRRLRLPAPRRRPGRAETQLLRKDGYSVKIHPFPRELRKDLKFLPPPSQLRFFWLRRGLLSLEVFTMIFKWSVILSSSGSVDSVVMSPCYLKTGFASWWVSSQRTQPSQDQEKEGFTITCSKEKVTV